MFCPDEKEEDKKDKEKVGPKEGGWAEANMTKHVDVWMGSVTNFQRTAAICGIVFNGSKFH